MNKTWDVSAAAFDSRITFHSLWYTQVASMKWPFLFTMYKYLLWNISGEVELNIAERYGKMYAMDKNRYNHHETQHSKSVYISCVWYTFDKTVLNCIKYSNKLYGDHSQTCVSFPSGHCFYSNDTKRIIVIYAWNIVIHYWYFYGDWAYHYRYKDILFDT